jgi:hypothetical protein
MPDPAAYPGSQFWEDVRREFNRTGLGSVERFDRDEMPWVLARFSMAWDSLEVLDGSVPQARFALFIALAGHRFVVTGYQWASDVVELIEFEIITWDHPEIEPG